MNRKITQYLGGFMLAGGLAAAVVLLSLNWVHDARFHDECYLAVSDWTAHKVTPAKTTPSPKFLAADEFLVAVDKTGRPINRPIAVFTEIRLPGEASSFILSKRIEANLAGLDLNGYSLVFFMIIACALSLALIGLVLFTQNSIRDRIALPWLFGSAPVVGFALAKAHFYFLYLRPWDVFTQSYYVDNPGPQFTFPFFLVSVILGGIAAMCAWGLQLANKPRSSATTPEQP